MIIIECLLLTLIIFLFNGVTIFNYFRIKNWLLIRVLADFYLSSGKNFLFNKKDAFIFLLIILFFFLPKIEVSLEEILFLGLIFLILLKKRKTYLQKIPLTFKGFFLLIIFLLLNFLIILTSSNFLIVSILALSLSQLMLFSFGILIFEVLTSPYLLFLRELVYKKLKKTNLKKIIIVGSYGKSTTKEFLAQFLNEKYKVLTPQPRINHEYAILKFLLQQKLENFDFLVLELGSYFMGNIKWLTKRIIPDYLFITGITYQHYFLFGEKIENVIKAEGTEALTYMKKGKIFLNSNHEHLENLLAEIKKLKNKEIKIVSYGKGGDYDYQIIRNDLKSVEFELKTKNLSFRLETKIIFPTQIENLVGVLAFIFEENLFTIEEIKNILIKIELPEGFLKLKVKDNFYLFDDSYNANPKGVWEGIDFFKDLDFDFKIIIFNGLLELGKETKNIYEKISKKMEEVDKVIFTSENVYQFFKNNLQEKALFLKNEEDLKNYFQELKLKYKKIGIWISNRFPENFKNFFLFFNNDKH